MFSKGLHLNVIQTQDCFVKGWIIDSFSITLTLSQTKNFGHFLNWKSLQMTILNLMMMVKSSPKG